MSTLSACELCHCPVLHWPAGQQQENIALAQKYLTRALEIFERLGTPGEPDKVRHSVG